MMCLPCCIMQYFCSMQNGTSFHVYIIALCVVLASIFSNNFQCVENVTVFSILCFVFSELVLHAECVCSRMYVANKQCSVMCDENYDFHNLKKPISMVLL